MSRNLVTVLVVLLAVAGGGVWYFSKDPRFQNFFGSVGDSIQDVVGAGKPFEAVERPLLARVRADAILVFDLVPGNFQPLIDWVKAIAENVRQTKVWKDNNLDEKVKAGFDEGVRQSFASRNPDAEVTTEQALRDNAENWQLIIDVINSVKEISFVATGDSFEIHPGIAVPRAAVAVSFTSKEKAREWFDKAEKELRAKPEPPSKTLVSYEPNRISMTVNEEVEGVQFQAALQLVDQNLYGLFGTTSQETVFSDKEGDALFASGRKGAAVQAFIPKAPVYFQANYEKIVGLVDKAMQSPEVPEEVRKEAAPLLQIYRDFSEFGASIGVADGIQGRTCISGKKGSAGARMYESLAPVLAEDRSPITKSLISDKTFFAFSFKAKLMAVGFDYFINMMPQVVAQDPNPESAEILKVFEQVRQVFVRFDTRFAFKEITNTIQAGPIGLTPAGTLVFSGSSLKDEALLNEFKKFVETDLAPLIAEQGAPLHLAMKKDLGGRDYLEVTSATGLSALGQVIDGNSLVLAMDTAGLESTRNAVKAEKGFFDNYDLRHGRVDLGLKNSDFFGYLGLKAVTELLSPFAGMIAMGAMQDPSVKVTPEDVQEFLEKAKTNMFWYQASSMRDEVACSDGRMVILKKNPAQ